jgi:uncharacterized FlgJ-related protein
MKSKMYKYIDLKLLEELNKKELKDVDFNLIILKKNDSCPSGLKLEIPLILENVEFKMMDDVKKYILLKHKKHKFINKLFDKKKIEEVDFTHLRQWYSWRKLFNETDEETNESNKQRKIDMLNKYKHTISENEYLKRYNKIINDYNIL